MLILDSGAIYIQEKCQNIIIYIFFIIKEKNEILKSCIFIIKMKIYKIFVVKLIFTFREYSIIHNFQLLLIIITQFK